MRAMSRKNNRDCSDPLRWLEDRVIRAEPVAWLKSHDLGVFDGELARKVLGNTGHTFVEHSDFFGTGSAAFGPREAQRSLAAMSRSRIAVALKAAIDADWTRRLPAVGRWPGVATQTMFDLLAHVLVGKDRSPAFHLAVKAIVDARIVHRKQGDVIGGWLRRRAMLRAFENEMRHRCGDADFTDMVAIVGQYAGRLPTHILVRTYLAFVFATVGSTAFAFSWAVLLATRHGVKDWTGKQVVLEALRLYPPAWLLTRFASAPGALGEIPIASGDAVTVCPYAIHRRPDHWPDASAFDPARWQADSDFTHFLPFGAGPHACVAAGPVIDFLASSFDLLVRNFTLELLDDSDGIDIGVALAPRPFKLRLRPN